MSFKNYPVIACADFNIDILKARNFSSKYHDVIESNGFEHLITKSTRVANTSETLLDHFIPKDLKVKSAQVRDNLSFSDHSPITLEFYSSHLKDEDTETYCGTSFVKSILSVNRFNQEISKTMQTINYSESLDDCFN